MKNATKYAKQYFEPRGQIFDRMSETEYEFAVDICNAELDVPHLVEVYEKVTRMRVCERQPYDGRRYLRRSADRSRMQLQSACAFA